MDYFRMASTGSTRDHFLQAGFLVLPPGTHLDYLRIANDSTNNGCIVRV